MQARRYQQYSQLENILIGANSFEELSELLEKNAPTYFGQKIILKKGHAQTLPDGMRRKELLVPGEKKLQGSLAFGEDFEEEEISMIYLFIQEKLKSLALRSDAAHLSQMKVKGRTIEDWQRSFAAAAIPFALLNKNNEILFHNLSFVQLNLSKKEYAVFRNGQQVSIGQQVYRCERISTQNRDYEIIRFLPLKALLEKNKKPTAEELGIISSSIAHELNNPLGGISGALDVLLLDELDSQTRKLLSDMKNGVLRCKKLVETFLGFSRLKRSEESPKQDIMSSLTSALELIRFRLIEDNIRINPKYCIYEDYAYNFNPHALSMVFYMIIGETLTAFGHQNLVRHEKSLNFNFSFVVEKEEVSFINHHELTLSPEFFESKLLNHLLETQDLKLSGSGPSVRLVRTC